MPDNKVLCLLEQSDHPFKLTTPSCMQQSRHADVTLQTNGKCARPDLLTVRPRSHGLAAA